MNDTKRIPVPWKHRWRRFRYSSLPMLGFFAALLAVGWLWSRAVEMPHAIGEIEAVRVNVSAGVDGKILPVSQGFWKLYDTVEKNQVLVQLDEGPLRAQIKSIEQEVVHLQKELEAEGAKLADSEADRMQSYQSEAVRLRVELEKRRLAVLEHQVQLETDRLESQRTSAYYEGILPLYEKKMISEQELTNAKMYRDQAAKQLEEDLKVVREAESQEKVAQERLEKLPEYRPADVPKQLAPFEAEIAVQQALIRTLEVEIGRLTIRSPVRGMVCAIYHWPNEEVPSGEPILTVASDQTRYLVSYVRQEQRLEPKEGMVVDVRRRAAVTPAVQTVVERVGPQVEPVPLHLCRDPKIPEWGLPVRIALPEQYPGRPGELFEIFFKTTTPNTGGT